MRQDPGAPAPPVLMLRYRLDDARLNLFIVIASLQAPLDTRVEDLRVELFIPRMPRRRTGSGGPETRRAMARDLGLTW